MLCCYLSEKHLQLFFPWIISRQCSSFNLIFLSPGSFPLPTTYQMLLGSHWMLTSSLNFHHSFHCSFCFIFHIMLWWVSSVSLSAWKVKVGLSHALPTNLLAVPGMKKTSDDYEVVNYLIQFLQKLFQ